MLIVLAKVGTMPGGHVRIKSKRLVPGEGELVWGMRVYPNGKPDRYGPQVWERMRVDGIDSETSRVFFSLF